MLNNPRLIKIQNENVLLCVWWVGGRDFVPVRCVLCLDFATASTGDQRESIYTYNNKWKEMKLAISISKVTARRVRAAEQEWWPFGCKLKATLGASYLPCSPTATVRNSTVWTFSHSPVKTWKVDRLLWSLLVSGRLWHDSRQLSQLVSRLVPFTSVTLEASVVFTLAFWMFEFVPRGRWYSSVWGGVVLNRAWVRLWSGLDQREAHQLDGLKGIRSELSLYDQPIYMELAPDYRRCGWQTAHVAIFTSGCVGIAALHR